MFYLPTGAVVEGNQKVIEFGGLNRDTFQFELSLGLTKPDGGTVGPERQKLKSDQVDGLDAGDARDGTGSGCSCWREQGLGL